MYRVPPPLSEVIIADAHTDCFRRLYSIGIQYLLINRFNYTQLVPYPCDDSVAKVICFQ